MKRRIKTYNKMKKKAKEASQQTSVQCAEQCEEKNETDLIGLRVLEAVIFCFFPSQW
jgi:ppGpp synthetase/RelA/SpoT-type nucleotidyltranferase